MQERAASVASVPTVGPAMGLVLLTKEARASVTTISGSYVYPNTIYQFCVPCNSNNGVDGVDNPSCC